MPTKAVIGIKNADNSVDAVIVYYDGGLDYVGSVLHTKYRQEAKVRNLVQNGHLRVLMGEVRDCEPMQVEDTNFLNFDDTIHFYGAARTAGADFAYLFDRAWFVRDLVDNIESLLQEALADE